MRTSRSEKTHGIWKESSFLVLASGQIVSQFGDNLLAIVLMWMAGSPQEPRYILAVVSFVRFLPGLFGILAGVFADRWDHRRTLMVTDAIRFGLIAVVVIFLVQGMSLWWILLVVGLVQIVGSIYGPSISALTPEVVSQHNLVAAEGFLQSAFNLAQMGGVLIGGVLLALIGMPTLVAGDAASFLVAGFSLYIIPDRRVLDTAKPRHRTSVKAPAGHPLLQYLKELSEGFYVVRRTPLLLRLVVADIGVNLAFAPLGLMLVSWTRRVLLGPSWEYGLFSAILYGGMIVGGFASSPIASRVGIRRLATVSPVIMGLAVAAVPFMHNVMGDTVALALFGFVGGIDNAAVSSWLVQLIPISHRARAFSLIGSLVMVSTPVGLGLFGTLLVVAPIRDLFYFCGTLSALTVLAFIGTSNQSKRADIVD